MIRVKPVCVKSYFSVSANSFALKIRHGFKESSIESSSNFFLVETLIASIMGDGVHIVRMNSHLQLNTSLFTQTSYTHMILVFFG